MADSLTAIPKASLDYAAANPNATVAQQVSAGVVPGQTPKQTTSQPSASTVNVNVGQPPPAAPTTTPTQQTTTQNTAQNNGQTAQAPLNFNGSVVDLLNQAGTDSSYQNRSKLAQTYGINGYTGTAAQNQELAKKFMDFYATKQGSQAPTSNPRAEIAAATAPGTAQEDPVKQFMDTYSAMNPVESQIYTQVSNALSTIKTRQSLVDLAASQEQELGITADKLQLADLNKIMRGSEDDIRNEITAAGGFATDSQVKSLTATRNKVLLNQAQYLQDAINAKQDYVDRIVSLTQADRAEVDKQLDQKLGISKTLFDMSETMQNNAKENYKQIVNSVGWGGLAAALKDNPEQMKNVEKMFGLAPGELEALGKYKKPLTEMEQAQLEGQKLSNQTEKLQQKKLTQDLKEGPAISTSLTDFGTKDNPHYKLINSKTGAVIADYGSTAPEGNKQQQVANQQQSITDISNLITDPGLNSAVGPNMFGRIPLADYFSGAKSNFIAGVEQVTRNLTLDKLIAAKGSGVTFGALSEGELGLVAGAASKIGTWAIKDGAGNVTGYNVDEASFKKELDKINNYQKLDFVLKGGDPASVGVQEQADGTFWTKNSDGSYTQIR